MANFCTRCGKPLPESGICDCMTAAEPQAEAQQQAAGQQSAPQQAAPAAENVYVKKTKNAINGVLPLVKGYWKDPMNATLGVMREKNMAVTIVLMVVNALVTGLLMLTAFHKLVGDTGVLEVTVPFFSTMLFGILVAAVALALSAVGLFAMLKISHVDTSFNYVIMAVGVNSLFCTVCLVLALLFALIGWLYGVLLAPLLSVIVWGVVGVLLLTKIFGVSMSGLGLTLTVVLFGVVLALNAWIGGKLVQAAAGKIEVGGYELEEAFDAISDMDVEDILGGMLYGF